MHTEQVLSDELLRTQYYSECAAMAERIRMMRKMLRVELKAAGSTHDWTHVTDQIGMFAFTGNTSRTDRAIACPLRRSICLSRPVLHATLNSLATECFGRNERCHV